MKNRFVAAVLAALASMLPVFAGGMNKANLAKVSYSLVSGGTETNQAQGRPKLLVFVQAGDSKSQTLARNLAADSAGLSGIDVVLVETKRANKVAVSKFREKYAPAMKVAFDTKAAAEDSMRSYAKLANGGKTAVLPVLVYIDGGNRVQFFEHGKAFAASHIKAVADGCLGSSGAESNASNSQKPQNSAQTNSSNPSNSQARAASPGAVSAPMGGISLGGTTFERTAEVLVRGATIRGGRNAENSDGVFVLGRIVTLSDFIIGKYEVTQELYEAVMKGQSVVVGGKRQELKAAPSACVKGGKLQHANPGEQRLRPVDGVTWFDAVYFCNLLSERLGLTKAYSITVTKVGDPRYPSWGGHITDAKVSLVKGANGYRLPSEAEWEFAARGGNPNAAAWGFSFSGAASAKGVSYMDDANAALDSVGWYILNNTTGSTKVGAVRQEGRGTHEVGMKSPNALGIYDMSGNVQEWCHDNFLAEDVASGAAANVTDPFEGSVSGKDSGVGARKVYRGGDWSDTAYALTVCARDSLPPGIPPQSGEQGFRLVRAAR